METKLSTFSYEGAREIAAAINNNSKYRAHVNSDVKNEWAVVVRQDDENRKPDDHRRLNNGAFILKQKGDKVLCDWNEQYVVWTVDKDGNAYWGHYFNRDVVRAVGYFDEVTKEVSNV